uniref:Transmembrane protein n=1 Tax=Oryza nivara TaxID=4536 RepID=A0A0E0J4G7_ORYNI
MATRAWFIRLVLPVIQLLIVLVFVLDDRDSYVLAGHSTPSPCRIFDPRNCGRNK